MVMRISSVRKRQMRPYYNLPSKSEHGRKMTGFLTPYRHWMWKQNELWRNVHEAQFEHLRKVYKRQWFESFRVNADEYIYKYNITKAAQLAQWENEMQAQEKKRIETRQMAEGRQALKKKHLDLLREFHERQFFFWHERASERLQSMSLINYISQDKLQDHIDRELDKYVSGGDGAYPLNFAGQMPLLEDADGRVSEVPDGLMANHAAEHPRAPAAPHVPRAGDDSVAGAEERLLRLLVDAREEALDLREDDSAALSETIADMSREEEAREADVRVARSMEETDSEREVGRRAYIDRGKTGARAIFRRTPAGDAESASEGSAPVRRRRRVDKAHALQEQQDALLSQLSSRSLKEGADAAALGRRGEVVESRGRIRDKAVIPTQEVLMQSPELAAGSVPNARVQMKETVDKRYKRGKYKEEQEKNSGDEDL